jgi:hypothetical protein
MDILPFSPGEVIAKPRGVNVIPLSEVDVTPVIKLGFPVVSIL